MQGVTTVRFNQDSIEIEHRSELQPIKRGFHMALNDQAEDFSGVAAPFARRATDLAPLPKFIKIGANGLALPADYLGTDHVAFYVRSRNIWMTARKIHRDRQTWKAGEKLCAECSLLGFRDWRYPDIEDWEAVRDLTKFSPAADTNILPDLDCAGHWSRTPYAGDKSSVAWFFGALSGYVGPYGRGDECFVLAVRSASPPSQ